MRYCMSGVGWDNNTTRDQEWDKQERNKKIRIVSSVIAFILVLGGTFVLLFGGSWTSTIPIVNLILHSTIVGLISFCLGFLIFLILFN